MSITTVKLHYIQFSESLKLQFHNAVVFKMPCATDATKMPRKNVGKRSSYLLMVQDK